MNKRNIGIGIFAIAIIVVLAFSGSRNTRELSGAGFMETYQKTTGAVLLDVRTSSEYAAGHLEGAINVDFENPTFSTEIEKLDKEKPYFVYCRSGNRSGQAIATMKKEGFADISELKGGIASNQSALRLVIGTGAASEYVIDESDIVDGATLIASTTKSTLSENEVNGLMQMREEEKLARDVYATLGAKWGGRIFLNIANSEQTHTDAVKVLLDRYALEDPSVDDTVGVFRSPAIQKLYDDLTLSGQRSLLDALIVGATIEDLDIRDLEVLMKETSKQDILITYRNLQKGSRNHMRAFINNVSAIGGAYQPQYITQETFTAIMNSPQERGRM